jgi:pyridine nucleotide-disulfide oxidoreductase family protein
MRRLLLLGGGHAHLYLLRRLARAPIRGVAATLVSPADRSHYSAMFPGYMQGTYEERQLAVDLTRLCAAVGVSFVCGSATRIDPARRIVETDAGACAFDVLSLDVGADVASIDDVPGAAAHALTLRRPGAAPALRARVEGLIAERHGAEVRVCVTGGGAAAVEVSLALHRRIKDGQSAPVVAMFERGPAVVPDYAPGLRQRVTDLLDSRGIRVHAHSAIVAVEPSAVVLDAGERVPADLTVWLTGPAPPSVLAGSGLPRDARGFLLVDSTLRAVDGAPVWGAGDCVALAGHPWVAKAGVYAVREAPVLDRNIRAAFGGAAPARYRPQRAFLSLLNTADGRALARWRGLSAHARWAWWLKDRIDRHFVRAFQRVYEERPGR